MTTHTWFLGWSQMRATLSELRVFLTDGSPADFQLEAIGSKISELKDRYPITNTQATRAFLDLHVFQTCEEYVLRLAR